ncbi:flagellar protein FlgN [Desulfurivibrio sp. D14AmB]|uniref:flagellar protein FlgN n=1 Tax=Desulfurivibrio sp. D14AmB TaxID=3374370 RepID=UPI00376F37A5
MRQKIPSGIFDLIDQEFSLCRELLSILAREQAAVVALDMSGLVALSRRKAEQIELVREVDEQLRLRVEQLTGQPAANAVRLSDLVAMAQGEEKARLERQRLELVALRQEIAAKSVINHHFVEDTKRHLREAITLLTSSVSEQRPNYGKPGQVNRRGSGQPSLISRAI